VFVGSKFPDAGSLVFFRVVWNIVQLGALWGMRAVDGGLVLELFLVRLVTLAANLWLLRGARKEGPKVFGVCLNAVIVGVMGISSLLFPHGETDVMKRFNVMLVMVACIYPQSWDFKQTCILVWTSWLALAGVTMYHNNFTMDWSLVQYIVLAYAVCMNKLSMGRRLNSDLSLSVKTSQGAAVPDANGVGIRIRNLRDNITVYTPAEMAHKLDKILASFDSKKHITSPSQHPGKISWIPHDSTVPNHAVEHFESEIAGGREVFSRSFYEARKSLNQNWKGSARRETYTATRNPFFRSGSESICSSKGGLELESHGDTEDRTSALSASSSKLRHRRKRSGLSSASGVSLSDLYYSRIYGYKERPPEESGADEKPVFYTGERKLDNGRGIKNKKYSTQSEDDSDEVCTPYRMSMDEFSVDLHKYCKDRYFSKLVLDWDFGSGGIFQRLNDENMPEVFKKRPLTSTFCQTVQILDCVRDLGIEFDRLAMYMEAIEDKYLPRDRVQYHNSFHATDVVQSCAFLLETYGVRRSFMDPALSSLALLFGAAVHDVAHPGRNQSFHVKTQSHLAILYSDRSVLEHHHLAVAFTTLRSNEDLNFLDVLDDSDVKLFREKVIQMVLATDMALHLENLNTFKELIGSKRHFSRAQTAPVPNMESGEMQSMFESDNNTILCAIVHCADIANVSKTWKVYQQWIPLIFEEFFAQGDEERELGLDAAASYDRHACFPCEMQTYFIELFVDDFFGAMAAWLPPLEDILIRRLSENKKHLKKHLKTKIEDMW